MEPSKVACASLTPNSSQNAAHNSFSGLPIFQTKKFVRNIRNSSTLESWKGNKQYTLISCHTLLYLWLAFYEQFFTLQAFLCLLEQAKRNSKQSLSCSDQFTFVFLNPWNHITLTYLTGIKMIIWTGNNWSSRLTFATVLWYSVLY